MIDTYELEGMINAMELKLAETKDSAKFTSGPVPDALKVVIPMMEDQLKISRALLEHLKTTVVVGKVE